METILKPVPSIEGLEISPDGNTIYYKGKFRQFRKVKGSNGKYYKILYLRHDGKDKRLSVAKLVFEAYIGTFPKGRHLNFIDRKPNNTSYKNLSPKPLLFTFPLKKVMGYDELYINHNGTLIVQYGYMIDIHKAAANKNNTKYYGCVIHHGNKSRTEYVHRLVAMAYKHVPIGGRVLHMDGNTLNNNINNLLTCPNKEYIKKYMTDLSKYREQNALKKIAIPKEDTEKVKKRLMQLDTLADIAKDYKCSDMAIVRFRKRHFSPKEIAKMNKANGINTTHTPKTIVKKVIQDLKAGIRQYKVAEKYGLSPTVICRINRQYIKQGKTI